MTIKVGINGFGRIGKLALRAAWDWPDLEFVQINDPGGDPATHAHLLNFDSVHGRWQHEAQADGDAIVIAGRRLPLTRNRAIADTDWSGCDLVIEASGVNKTRAALQPYLDQGVRRVVVSAPVKEPGVLNIVLGVNDQLFDPAAHPIVTAASCTTNYLAPVEGDPRGTGHSSRLDHHHSRPDQHPEHSRSAAQGYASRPCLRHEPDPDQHRLGNRDC